MVNSYRKVCINNLKLKLLSAPLYKRIRLRGIAQIKNLVYPK